ncbi:hypothetical protein PG637_09735 [Riemerella anatipestifer]|nr:hypothetical protein [Riemerella anatipestifer]MDY3325946.1 hypothetical protein [Riemerella anatipestifer]MDY3351856.1 hypothetical protein [Riemerella anatipestifer]MDY3352505.1 hypothetical protein [Riemerella anatipestifer]
MIVLQELEKQINLNLIIIVHKLNALKSVLTDEQLEVYKKSIEESKTILKSSLEDNLPSEQVDEVLSSLDI